MYNKITQELAEIKNYKTTDLRSKYERFSKLPQDYEPPHCQEGLYGVAVISLFL